MWISRQRFEQLEDRVRTLEFASKIMVYKGFYEYQNVNVSEVVSSVISALDLKLKYDYGSPPRVIVTVPKP